MNITRRISQNLQELARFVDRAIEKTAGERCGFFLFIFAAGRVEYVGSDDDRRSVIKAMREIIAKWEAGMPDVPGHEVQ